MYAKFLRILNLALSAILFFATIQGQATKAQPALSSTTVHKNQSIGNQSSLDLAVKNEYQARSALLFPDHTNNLIMPQAAIASAEQ